MRMFAWESSTSLAKGTKEGRSTSSGRVAMEQVTIDASLLAFLCANGPMRTLQSVVRAWLFVAAPALLAMAGLVLARYGSLDVNFLEVVAVILLGALLISLLGGKQATFEFRNGRVCVSRPARSCRIFDLPSEAAFDLRDCGDRVVKLTLKSDRSNFQVEYFAFVTPENRAKLDSLLQKHAVRTGQGDSEQ